ncbi:MAG: hypothetical protein IJ306_01315 [Oscillospiraceae bacterium]|nr:hypothetical protein [Oscillospiraceae bacterium]
MSETRRILKKLLALSAAVIMVAFAPAEAFATGNVGLSETSSEETSSGEEPVVSVDYSKLELQVAMVNGLNEYDYTKETWAVLDEAMQSGLALLQSADDQSAVTSAAKAIEEAVSGLVRMDYSKLENALTEVYNRIGDDTALYDIWSRINEAEKKARPLLVSGNQAAVDEAAKEITALLEELDAIAGTEKEPEVVIKEVEVEVPPSDDFCNIPMHRTWPVLFFISLALNVAMAVLMFYVFAKRRNTVDNIPLINYDIDDDMDLGDYDIEDDDK